MVGLAEFTLEVPSGACMGFLGPNGAGKTTAIRLMLGMLRPTGGHVSVMGHDLARERLAALANVGYLPGELGLIREITGAHMLTALGRLHPRPPVLRDTLLKALQLDDDALRRPVRQYSRGMKQKLGLVSALQHDPPVIILDEPTSGLDPVIQARVLEWLGERASAGRTVFFSSHVLGEVEALCDHVAMVRGGRLLTVESVSDLARERLRSVTIEFAEATEPTAYADVAGVGPTSVSGRTHAFSFNGDPSPLMAALSHLRVARIAIEPARLEDLFRSRYGSD